ncbi:MAG: hypothetical protein QXR71_03175 [Candidatus Aenigmatarchaeota archaeon]
MTNILYYMIFNKKEFKLFATFFIFYCFFVFWLGWKEQSHFALIRAIVDEGRFEINSYYNQTGDRSYYKGNFYSDKEPGLSFLGVSIYSIWKFVYFNLFSRYFVEKNLGTSEFIVTYVGERKVPIIDFVDPGFFVLSSMILMIVFTSSLFSSLLLVILFRISRFFTKNMKYRVFLTFISGFCTLIFPYSLVFFEHSVATFFLFLTFYLLLKAKRENLNDYKYFILAGLSLGLSITLSAPTFIVVFIYIFYILSLKKQKIFYFVIAIFIGVLPFLLYNYIVFENPVTLPRYFLDPEIWSKIGGIHGLKKPNFFVAFKLLFDPYKGLLFYYPIFVFSFIGLFYMYKKFKTETILILLIFFVFLIFNSSWWAWWGGVSFGPRHLTPLTPFLMLPITFVFENFFKKKVFKIFFSILVFYSMLVNLSGLEPMPGDIIDIETLDIYEVFKSKINTFQVLQNPLFDYHIPLFLRDGPRSRIFENLINLENIDIRFLLPEHRLFFPFLYFHIPFLSLLPVSLFVFIIWRREPFFKKIVNFILKHNLWILGLIAISSAFLYISNPSEKIVLGKGWYPPSPNEGYRWMKLKGEIILLNPEDIEDIAVVKLYLQSYFEDRKVDLYFNGELIDSFNVFPNGSDIYTKLLTLKPGRNTLILKADKCLRVSNIKKDINYRCLSLRIINTTILYLNKMREKISFFYAKNWYNKENGEEIRWMKNNGTILLYYFDNPWKKMVLEFKLVSPNLEENKIIFLYFNNNLLDILNVSKKDVLVRTSPLFLNFGENVLVFHVKECCAVVSKNESDIYTNIGIRDIYLESLGE